MGWKSIDILCQDDVCGHRWNDVVDRALENEPFVCPKCTGEARKTISKVMILNSSWPDGHKRSDGVGRAMEIDRLENHLDDARDRGDTAAMSDVIKEMGAKNREGGGAE